jgi:hypothetical protein
MANYVNFNEQIIRFTDNNNVVYYIPKDSGNTDYKIFLAHEETEEDREAQNQFNAEQVALKASEQAEAEANATAKAALLAQLGITEEQAKLLLS